MSDMKINLFNTFFTDIDNKNANYIKFRFKGLSLNYKDSYIYGKVNCNKLENKIWKYSIEIYINSIYTIINDEIDNITNDIKIEDLWNLIFNNKKLSNGFNTINKNSNNINYEYIIHLRSILNENNENILYVHIENYKWNQKEFVILPDQLINTTFYSEIYNFIDNKTYVNSFIFNENNIEEINYENRELENIISKANHINFDFDNQTNIMNIEINNNNDSFFLFNTNQGKYKKEIINLSFNDNFRSVKIIRKYYGIDLDEINNIKALLLNNDWILNLNYDVPEIQTVDYLYTRKRPGIILNQEGFFPEIIINKKYFSWILNNINNNYYLKSYNFLNNKLVETTYIDESLTLFIDKKEYNIENFNFDKNIPRLVYIENYEEDQFIINNIGRYKTIRKKYIFDKNYNNFYIVSRYLNMYLEEIQEIKTNLLQLNWKINEKELWVESPDTGINTFDLQIPLKPE